MLDTVPLIMRLNTWMYTGFRYVIKVEKAFFYMNTFD